MHFSHQLKLKLIVQLYLNELTTWEFDFVSELYASDIKLSTKQEDKLNQIWDKARKLDRIFKYTQVKMVV